MRYLRNSGKSAWVNDGGRAYSGPVLLSRNVAGIVRRKGQTWLPPSSFMSDRAGDVDGVGHKIIFVSQNEVLAMLAVF